jgi:hypothetical protein
VAGRMSKGFLWEIREVSDARIGLQRTQNQLQKRNVKRN